MRITKEPIRILNFKLNSIPNKGIIGKLIIRCNRNYVKEPALFATEKDLETGKGKTKPV